MAFTSQNPKKGASVENTFQKIKHYCAYQERSHFEAREKLYSLGLYKLQVEALLAQLIEEDYLNEERFACSFVRGRFSLKKWGRVKIKYELKMKKVSDYNIKIGLKEIKEEDYLLTLQKIVQSKWDALHDENNIARQAKTMAYLLQKGYEASLVHQAVKSILAK